MARKYNSRLKEKFYYGSQVRRIADEKIQRNVAIKSSSLSSNLRTVKVPRVICTKITVNLKQS